MPTQAAIVQVYVRLIDEGAWSTRPTLAVELGEGRYRLLPTQDYDPRDEIWEFPPESVVTVEECHEQGGDFLLASRRAA